ncbi:TonB-linked SusC/RagA family outer membrane protein [Parabacteroides sp. PH5-13]|uniref:SusC/RagA family TonB-linked outer membrane protein n=1 Tax=unclassified Parabacteroides TaxID=2649774 RepID=UPI002476E0D5|nr:MULTISPECIES: TonB-dependent receptor [unclassified Parabacteroides]MDH6304221.1 TonB-linked SusC/RagA family outer membrane protein [Parabacteroides sp. PH5-39]MDH6318724.1 TonB-linked SusC/RagA family outer membrane protein [Parabacteroides sp. PH5-13]MDH6322454.1 TonB-linked SusC/RagA family outer membrane protein [Parabacteroides sp. PH5-8]MDH6383721.1 TonB-linked SusC/RagA family outer membrane protein [Parabacteroides sp. PH5-17]MDH6392945.1 TonB-linked SusC/RagA family outer membrane
MKKKSDDGWILLMKITHIMKFTSILILFSTISVFAEASLKSDEISQQTRAISGKVTGTNDEAIIGANVTVRGTTTGTITDIDGNFTLNVPPNAVLVVSYIGYITQEIPVGSSTNIFIILKEDTQALDEIVVVGYGVQRKISVTNAISSIDSKDISERNSTNTTQALQGKLPGLTVIDRGGAPGEEELTLRIRGVTSLNDNNPLVLIDGVPGSLSQVNPVDIESVSVLKDAASAAIYGSRAAAGVVLVTTKAPKEGKLTISYDGYVGFARSNNLPEHMDAVTYMKHQNTAYMNTYGYKFYTDEYIQQWPENHAKDPERYPKPNTWTDALFSTAPQHSHTLTLSGGNEKITNRISVRYMDQEGVLPNYEFNISELRSRNEFKVNKRLTLSSNINVRLTERKGPYSEWESYNRMWQNSQWGVPVYKDGSYGLSVDSYSPLINAKERGTSKTKRAYIMGIFRGDLQIFDWVKLNAQYSAQINYGNRKSFENKYDFTDKLYPERRTFNTINRMTDRRDFSREDQIDLQLIFNKKFKKHVLSGILGYSEIHYEGDNLEGYRQNFYNNELQTISMGANDATRNATGGYSEWGLRSYFARANYDYDGRYLLEVNARYDGSSRFAKDHQFGFFPSFSAGWRISGEEFWEPLKATVNELKLRGSWGEVGSQQVGLYSFMKTYNQNNYIFNEQLATGYRIVDLASEEISWETTRQLNFGLDAYLLDSKINLSLDYYKKRTEDILLRAPIPTVMGLNPTNTNAGIVENKGWEFLVGFRQPFGDFGVEMNFNANYNKNEVISLAGTGPHISAFGNSDYRTITTEGKPINSFYGFETDGFFQTQEEVDNYAKWDGSVGPGDIKYVDQNMDGELTPEDFVIFGNEMPDWTFSSNMSVSWKGLRLDLFWQGVAGSDKLMTGAILEHGIWGGFTHKVWADYWTPENPNAKYPRPTKYTMKNAQISDFSMLNGNYLRLKNIRLSYDIPKKLCERISIDAVNVYVSATNLLTFSALNKYNIDPEMIERGQESRFPQTSVTTIGLNINF